MYFHVVLRSHTIHIHQNFVMNPPLNANFSMGLDGIRSYDIFDKSHKSKMLPEQPIKPMINYFVHLLLQRFHNLISHHFLHNDSPAVRLCVENLISTISTNNICTYLGLGRVAILEFDLHEGDTKDFMIRCRLFVYHQKLQCLRDE